MAAYMESYFVPAEKLQISALADCSVMVWCRRVGCPGAGNKGDRSLQGPRAAQ